MKTPAKKPARVPKPKPPSVAEWELRLYVAGPNTKSVAAFRNLEKICEEHLAGRYHLEVIDLSKHPASAQADQILAVPTLVRRLPLPIRKFIGTHSDPERLLVEFDLRPNADAPATEPKRTNDAG